MDHTLIRSSTCSINWEDTWTREEGTHSNAYDYDNCVGNITTFGYRPVWSVKVTKTLYTIRQLTFNFSVHTLLSSIVYLGILIIILSPSRSPPGYFINFIVKVGNNK